jgi:hypothetical protein
MRLLPASSFLCAFSIITTAASTIAPMAMAMPPSDMMLALTALESHDEEGRQHAQRQGDDGHQRRAQVPEEHGADDRDDDELLDQLVP